ncbi:collectin-12-like [Crassostrea angulata]|uniref:collectin-12-like n=1 Tax=Magallana angulata TaxID=2784310 RepID=UPI0022B0C1D9|nr:collectin-12-like [Crassostrea angulata]
MLRTSSWFVAALLFSVHCLQRQFWYSRLYKEVTNSSLAILYGEDCSLVHCAGLCSGDDYCMEFLYSETSRHCIGLHCVKKDNYLYQCMGPESSDMLRYEKEFNWVEYLGHYYFYGEEKFSWVDAKLECQKKCAHLVEIETKEKSDWLMTKFLLKEDCGYIFKTCTAWTGLNDRHIEGHYVWDHSNTSMVFTNWYKFVPSKGDARDCVDILRNGEWNDRPCSFLNAFICEKSIRLY